MKKPENKETKKLRIKEERKKLKLTQQEIATKCGVHRVQWGRYERGEQDMSTTILANFGKLGADTGYILTGVRTPGNEQAITDKLQSATRLADEQGNVQATENLAIATAEWQKGIEQRSNRKQQRQKTLEELTFMLCSLDDATFDKAVTAISDIHTLAILQGK